MYKPRANTVNGILRYLNMDGSLCYEKVMLNVFCCVCSLSIFLSWRCLVPVRQAALVLLSWGVLKEFWITGYLINLQISFTFSYFSTVL